ncbi:MAG TPA: P27 family phage terminase small subunit [Candidatus Acidoferrum sp.]|nr:P27 family phage terminase small subunit [Candidatus Acidoferrum sp.]
MPAARKSDALHEVGGTTPHDRTPTDSHLVSGRPRCPKHLSPAARKTFKLFCRQLEARRALTEGDGFLLQLAAELWDRRARAQAKLLEEGEIKLYTRLDANSVAHQIEKTNMSLKVATDAERQLVAILDRLGLSPIAGPKIRKTVANNEPTYAPGTIGYDLLHADDAPGPQLVALSPEQMDGVDGDE